MCKASALLLIPPLEAAGCLAPFSGGEDLGCEACVLEVVLLTLLGSLLLSFPLGTLDVLVVNALKESNFCCTG